MKGIPARRFTDARSLVLLPPTASLRRRARSPTTSKLSKRERDVLDLVADGLSAQDIAEKITLSDRTVEWHISQAMRKLGGKNRVQAVVLAIHDGLIAA